MKNTFSLGDLTAEEAVLLQGSKVTIEDGGFLAVGVIAVISLSEEMVGLTMIGGAESLSGTREEFRATTVALV